MNEPVEDNDEQTSIPAKVIPQDHVGQGSATTPVAPRSKAREARLGSRVV